MTFYALIVIYVGSYIFFKYITNEYSSFVQLYKIRRAQVSRVDKNRLEKNAEHIALLMLGGAAPVYIKNLILNGGTA
jgi:hypothetical protein